jgi:hypothetical protein
VPSTESSLNRVVIECKDGATWVTVYSYVLDTQ